MPTDPCGYFPPGSKLAPVTSKARGADLCGYFPSKSAPVAPRAEAGNSVKESVAAALAVEDVAEYAEKLASGKCWFCDADFSDRSNPGRSLMAHIGSKSRDGVHKLGVGGN